MLFDLLSFQFTATILHSDFYVMNLLTVFQCRRLNIEKFVIAAIYGMICKLLRTTESVT